MFCENIMLMSKIHMVNALP